MGTSNAGKEVIPNNGNLAHKILVSSGHGKKKFINFANEEDTNYNNSWQGEKFVPNILTCMKARRFRNPKFRLEVEQIFKNILDQNGIDWPDISRYISIETSNIVEKLVRESDIIDPETNNLKRDLYSKDNRTHYGIHVDKKGYITLQCATGRRGKIYISERKLTLNRTEKPGLLITELKKVINLTTGLEKTIREVKTVYSPEGVAMKLREVWFDSNNGNNTIYMYRRSERNPAIIEREKRKGKITSLSGGLIERKYIIADPNNWQNLTPDRESIPGDETVYFKKENVFDNFRRASLALELKKGQFISAIAFGNNKTLNENEGKIRKAILQLVKTAGIMPEDSEQVR